MNKNEFKKELIEISKATGIDFDTLTNLPGDKVLQAVMAYNMGNLEEIYNVAEKQILIDVLKKVSDFLNIPCTELEKLPEDKINTLVGQFTMEINITPDEELKNSLIEVINEK